MKTFKNINFKKRDYEGTNIVACQAEQAPNEHWIEADESALDGLQRLWNETADSLTVTYYGYL